MIKDNVTFGKLTEGYVSIKTQEEYYEFVLVGNLRHIVECFCQNNALSIYDKAQQISYYMPVSKVELVLRTLQAGDKIDQLAKEQTPDD